MLTNEIVNFEQLGPDLFLIFHENICCGFSLEAPRQGNMFSWRNKKNIYHIPLISSHDNSIIHKCFFFFF